jgi:hypothetical protein
MAGVMVPVLPAAAGRGEGVGALDCPPAVQGRVRGTRSRSNTCEAWWRGFADSAGPSTACHAVPLPIRYADREE